MNPTSIANLPAVAEPYPRLTNLAQLVCSEDTLSELGGTIIVDTRGALMLHETGEFIVWYVAIGDVKMDSLEPIDHVGLDPIKGEAHYDNVLAENRIFSNAAKTYAQPPTSRIDVISTSSGSHCDKLRVTCPSTRVATVHEGRSLVTLSLSKGEFVEGALGAGVIFAMRSVQRGRATGYDRGCFAQVQRPARILRALRSTDRVSREDRRGRSATGDTRAAPVPRMHFGLARCERGQHASESQRILTQRWAHYIVAGRRPVAFVEDEGRGPRAPARDAEHVPPRSQPRTESSPRTRCASHVRSVARSRRR